MSSRRRTASLPCGTRSSDDSTSHAGHAWFEPAASTIGDAIIVLRSNDPKATVYGGTARRP
jgi:hypothetical protein